MATSRNGADVLKTAIVRLLRQDFLETRVPGITDLPLFIQDRPQPFTPEPYVYIYLVDSEEVDKTQTSSSRDYRIRAQVVTKSAHNRSAETERDAIVDEITRVIDTPGAPYINLRNEGYNVYIQNVGNVEKFVDDSTRGSTYFIANMELQFVADFVGTPESEFPVQDPIFTYAGFTFPPINEQIELGDVGTITGATTYPSNNNGWDFVSVTYSLASDSQGSILGNVVTVDGTDDPIVIITTLNYEFSTDTSITTTVVHTTNFERIRS